MTEPTVDLTNCDREPIHVPGSIQPIGFLLAVTHDWLIARATTNLQQYLGLDVDAVLGRPLNEIIPPNVVHDLRNKATMLRGPNSVERLFGAQLGESGLFNIAVHYSSGQIILEAEPGDTPMGDVTSMVRSMVSRLEQANDLTAFFREGARQVRAITGFDRVMVYRFSQSGSGEVVAEAARPGIGRFLGLHYPASDIPQQARILYTRNLLRVIADVGAEVVPIVPQVDERGEPLDLSLSMLRSVSPIHIEYLKNMGVEASMSISIVVDGQLWGLFACHHYKPLHPSFALRSVAELFAQMFSMQLEMRERKVLVEFERSARDTADRLLGAVASDEGLLRDPDWLAETLNKAIPSDGVGVWLSGNYAFSGLTPPTEEFRKIIRALNATAAGKVFATDHIASLIDGAEDYADYASGLLAIPVSRTPRDYVILFRSELIRSVRWAGDPHKPVEYGPNGPRLTPRKSFDEWKELVRHRSRPFTPSEIRVAETLRATLIEVVLRLADEASTERQKAHERQEVLIAELNHRVRNILGLIRGMIHQSAPESDDVRDFVKIVDQRIHALALAHNQLTEDRWGPAPLAQLIDTEIGAFLAEDEDRVVRDGPPVTLNADAFSTFALVLHEMVTNSTKYGSLSVPEGRVDLTWQFDPATGLEIDWRESNGPPVKTPTRQGFGTTIIQRSVPYDLGGEAQIEYAPEGFHAHFRIGCRHVAQSSPKASGARTRPVRGAVPKVQPGFLKGQHVLLVEDSLIIALDAEEMLERHGASEIMTASSVDAALDLIAAKPPTMAVLDINLGTSTSFAVADVLNSHGIPFLFATGYGEQARIPSAHQSRPILQKPYTPEKLAEAAGLLDLSGADRAD